MSQIVSTNYYLFYPPYKKSMSALTVEELNANLQYMAEVLCTALDMEIFTDLTEEDPTYGKALYLGFPNASHASLVLFRPWRSYTSYSVAYCLEFVGDNNLPISDVAEKFQRTGTSEYGFCMRSDIGFFGIMVTKNNNHILLQYFASNTYATTSAMIDAMYRKVTYLDNSGNNNHCPFMYINKTNNYYIHWYNDSLKFINTPVNKNTYLQLAFDGTEMNDILKHYLNVNKKYKANTFNLFNANDTNFTTPFNPGTDFKVLIMLKAKNTFPILHWSVGLIDGKYCFVLQIRKDSSATNRGPVVIEMGDTYEVNVIDLTT